MTLELRSSSTLSKIVRRSTIMNACEVVMSASLLMISFAIIVSAICFKRLLTAKFWMRCKALPPNGMLSEITSRDPSFNHGCSRDSAAVMRFFGSFCSKRFMKSCPSDDTPFSSKISKCRGPSSMMLKSYAGWGAQRKDSIADSRHT